MKNQLILILLILAGVARAQDATVKQAPAERAEEQQPDCIIWPQELRPIHPEVIDADEFYRKEIEQPYILAYWRDRKPLDIDSPFVHTFQGAEFTFDFIRHSVR